MISYLQLARSIKATGQLYINTPDTELTRKIERLVSAGVIQSDTFHNRFDNTTGIVIATTNREPASNTVQVSWWQSGARAGQFSQQAYPVIERKGEFVIVDLMGKPKGVKVEYTREAAA